jgi:hypothetical protein
MAIKKAKVINMDAIISEVNVMTDHQFKAIMVMVLKMLKPCNSMEELDNIKETIANLGGELGLRELAEERAEKESKK